MRAAAFVVVLAGCGSPRTVPVAPGPAPEPVAPPAVAAPTDVVDSGVILMIVGETTTRDEFTIRKVPTGFVVRTKTSEAKSVFGGEGELEVDAHWRPVRASYRQRSEAEGLTYKLGGTPLTLDVTRDDERNPIHVVATRAVDVFMEGPSMITMTALCRVEGEKIITSIGSNDDGVLVDHGAVAIPEGANKRVLIDMGVDFEVLCAGDKLLAGGLRAYDIWFVRDGHQADLESFKQLPALPKKTWDYPQDEAEPWKAYMATLSKNVVTFVDARRRIKRVTSFDLAGKQTASRDYKTKSGGFVTCELLAKQRLACLYPGGAVVELLDAVTLKPIADLAPLVKQAAPASNPDEWWFYEVDGDRVEITVNDTDMVRIDVAKNKATVVPRPKQLLPADKDPLVCRTYSRDGANIGGAVWKFDPSPEGTKLLRTRGKKELPPVEVALRYPQLLDCAPKGSALAVTFDGDKSVIAALAADTTLRWKVELGGHPGKMWTTNGLLLVSTDAASGRIVALDLKRGAIAWKAAGPVAGKP